MLTKKSFSKKAILFTTAGLLASGLMIFHSSFSVRAANNIASNAANQLDNTSIEYIKISSPNNYTEEHWRDRRNCKEKVENRDKNGNIINSTIITENGKRVINIGYENGKIEGYTWLLPSKIANANKDILSKSVLDDVKNNLKNKNWETDGTYLTINGKKAKKITSKGSDYSENIYLDEETGFPLKREIYKKENGTLKLMDERTEEYKELDNQSGDIFEYKGVQLKEIPAPVAGDNLGQG